MRWKKWLFYLSLIWLCSLLYMFNTLYLKRHSSGLIWYFSVCYFNDLLAPVVILSIANITLSLSGRSMEKLWQVALLTLACGLLWELGALLGVEAGFFRSSVTFDPTDFFAYFAGGFLFWLTTRLAFRQR